MSAPNNHQPSSMDVDGANSARGTSNSASTASTMDVDAAGSTASAARTAEEEAQRNKDLAKQRILRYHEQLLNGCGRNTCSNPDCASNPAAPKLNKTEAMRRAIELAQKKADLCPPKQQLVSGPATPDTRPSGPVSSPIRQPLAEPPAADAPVSATELTNLLDTARAANDFAPLIRFVGRVFGDSAAIDKAFPIRTDSGYLLPNEVSPAIDYPALDTAFDLLVDEDNKVSSIFAGATGRLVDSLGFQNVTGPLDYTPLRKFMILLENPYFEDPDSYPNFKKLLKAVSKLPGGHQKALTGWYSRYSPIRLRRVASRIQTYITVRWAMGNVFDTDIAPAVQVLACLYEASEHPGYDRLALHPGDNPQQCERPHLFHPITPSSAGLAASDRSPSPPDPVPPNPSLLSFIQATPSSAPASASSSQVMFAPFGVMPSTSSAASAGSSAVSAMEESKRESSHLISVSSKSVKRIDYSTLRSIDGGEVKLTGGRAMIPFEFFYNDAVNSEQDFKEDYKKWRDPRGKFSFCAYPFILDPASKSRILQVDAHYQMVAQFEEAMQTFLFTRQSPYLVLQVRRDNLIEDTLQQLQHVSKTDLKKPLKVKFVGEEGIDEGGVQKEFFQLVVKELFSPDLGYDMFVYDSETYSFWFNKDTMTTNMEFELIGMILGLAIYNSVILDVHLPLVAYKKLMKENVGFEDLEAMSPSTARGLRQLLEFDGDVESTYCRTFSVQYEVFGSMKTVDLKPKGSSIPLTNTNRAEYVDLYIDWFLNKSVEKQFNAFAHGFDLVAGGDALKLFRSEELELLVCGSPVLDFEALERVTQYEDGFTKASRTIRNFWQVVHRMSLEEKKKLLFFCTGSDRVPIKGLSNLSFTISKNGPDSERLPTAHTCFNHLLLPDYTSAEKLERFLKLAIENSQGFGLR